MSSSNKDTQLIWEAYLLSEGLYSSEDVAALRYVVNKLLDNMEEDMDLGDEDILEDFFERTDASRNRIVRRGEEFDDDYWRPTSEKANLDRNFIYDTIRKWFTTHFLTFAKEQGWDLSLLRHPDSPVSIHTGNLLRLDEDWDDDYEDPEEMDLTEYIPVSPEEIRKRKENAEWEKERERERERIEGIVWPMVNQIRHHLEFFIWYVVKLHKQLRVDDHAEQDRENPALKVATREIGKIKSWRYDVYKKYEQQWLAFDPEKERKEEKKVGRRKKEEEEKERREREREEEWKKGESKKLKLGTDYDILKQYDEPVLGDTYAWVELTSQHAYQKLGRYWMNTCKTTSQSNFCIGSYNYDPNSDTTYYSLFRFNKNGNPFDAHVLATIRNGGTEISQILGKGNSEPVNYKDYIEDLIKEYELTRDR